LVPLDVADDVELEPESLKSVPLALIEQDEDPLANALVPNSATIKIITADFII